ncbi:transmembrane protein 229B-like [Spea bombifrons]|uniref:transmembrane protein 229B-like n=1 Tax=Spea bombifrons TaxID=233779 RepID=UPI002349467D|nr:transmembrane protein 229B-like [Spea bombifrons]XP_053328614.1 transmembrane protein 229B-like [Spea bombifrons]
MDSPAPLGIITRFYIYAIHGYVCEILFTAACDFAATGDWKFQGITSIWALFIYGSAMLGIERMYLALRSCLGFLPRALLYTLWVYVCEFTSGWLLKGMGACPWDYSHFHYNYHGLVTLEYAPFWFMGCVILEKVLIWHTLRLRLDEKWEPQEAELKKDE